MTEITPEELVKQVDEQIDWPRYQGSRLLLLNLRNALVLALEETKLDKEALRQITECYVPNWCTCSEIARSRLEEA